MQKYVIALYIRLSIEDYKYDSLSIENQSLVLHEYAASMPEALNAEIMEFIDNGYSGTNFERPQVQKLIELVRANQIDCIIVKDFSRFGRNSIETGYFIERVFPLFHTRFISISDDFDSSKFKGDTGGMDVAFKYLISEYYSRDMSIKTKSAKYAKMQRGEYQSKICPYGYRKSADGRMEPDPEAAAVVQLIFQLAAEGINATAITRELFRRNIPTPGQYKAARGNHTHDISRCHGIWSTSTILRILEDERYTGVYVIGKRAVLEVGGNRSRLKDRESWYIIPDHHPAIIEKAVFDTAQASQLRFSQPNKKKRDYPLKGKAFCGCCGHALSRTMQKTSYYYCRHSEADEESRCHKMRLNAAELEQAVFLTLKKQLEAQLSTLNLGNQGVTEEGDAAEIQIRQIEDQLEKCRIVSPISGTVLTKYAERGEVTAQGKPLFKVADMKHVFLRAYVSGDQLSTVKLGQTVKVYADYGAEDRKEYKGKITWISGQAEFTPKTIQTRDERANLVYAVKIAVENDDILIGIIRHHAHGAACVEVPGHIRQGEAKLRDLLHGPIKELIVVGFEMNLSAALQHLAVFFQEIPVGQPALFLVALGPGIAEINVQAIHLARGEQLRQQGGVRIDEEHIFQPLTDDPLHGHHHGVRHLLHGNEQRVRPGLRRSGGEAALAAAQLHPQLPCLRHQLPPAPP